MMHEHNKIRDITVSTCRSWWHVRIPFTTPKVYMSKYTSPDNLQKEVELNGKAIDMLEKNMCFSKIF